MNRADPRRTGSQALRVRQAPPPRRDDVVLDAEIRLMLRELHAVGPLRREVLARRCHSATWRSGAFRRAIDAAVAQRRLRVLPFGFIAAVNGDDEQTPRPSEEGRSARPARRGNGTPVDRGAARPRRRRGR